MAVFSKLKVVFGVSLLVVVATLFAADPKIILHADRETPIYRAKEPIVFNVSVEDRGNDLTGAMIQYQIYVNGAKFGNTCRLSATDLGKVTTSLDKPGWVMVRFQLLDKNGKGYKVMFRGKKSVLTEFIGALVEPDKLRADSEPADFDEFWRNELKKLDAVPPQATYVEVKSPTPGVKVYDVTIPCVGRRPVRGYLAVPENAAAKSAPAVVTYHGSGVRSSSYSAPVRYAKKFNAIALDINAHGIENGKPKKYYDELNNGELKGYRTEGKESRDTIYFREMFLRVAQSLRFMKSRPEWDGKHLVCAGASQAGAQSIVGGALDKDVTGVVAAVPALCDHLADRDSENPRQSGWPRFFFRDKFYSPEIEKAIVYYDCAYFARRVTCPIVVWTGFGDMTCAPSSVVAMYNNLKTDKKTIKYAPCGQHTVGSYKGSEFDSVVGKFLTE